MLESKTCKTWLLRLLRLYWLKIWKKSNHLLTDLVTTWKQEMLAHLKTRNCEPRVDICCNRYNQRLCKILGHLCRIFSKQHEFCIIFAQSSHKMCNSWVNHYIFCVIIYSIGWDIFLEVPPMTCRGWIPVLHQILGHLTIEP